MKMLVLIIGCAMASAFTPFAQDGSVTSDSMILEERIEKAHENRIQQERADQVIEENKRMQKQEEMPITQEKSEELNEAEKLVK